MRIREVEEMIPEVHREIMKKFPGTNKMYCALLAAFVEACEHHRFAMQLINDQQTGVERNWEAYGQQYVASWVIRKIAEQLGVPNQAVESSDGVDQIQ